MSNYDSTGEPAFPCNWIDRDSMGEERVRDQAFGLTMRDYFAAAALQGLLACQAPGYEYTADIRFETASKESFKYADKMIQARGGQA